MVKIIQIIMKQQNGTYRNNIKGGGDNIIILLYYISLGNQHTAMTGG